MQGGGFRIDPADRPYAASEPDRAPPSWNPGDQRGLRLGATRLGVAALFMVVAAGGLWLAYSKGRSSAGSGGVPLIKADQTAMKVKPDNPGGVADDGGTPVYNVGATNGAKVEQLLPPPEQPLAKPPPDAVPAPAPVQAATANPAPAVSAAAPLAASPSGTVPSAANTSAAPVTAAPVASAPTVPAPAAPAPEIAEDTAPAPAAPPPKPAKKAEMPKQVAAAGGPLRIQIAATKDIASAHKEWARLKAAHGDVLGDLKAFGVRVDLGERGIFYRIQAGPIATRADASKRCAVLKQSGIGCIIVKQP
jgi:cell division septation protein DedD